MPTTSIRTPARPDASDRARRARPARAASADNARQIVKKVLHTAKMLVVGHVQFKRKGKDILIVLEERHSKPPPAEAATPPAEAPSPEEAAQLRDMQRELADVLDYHPGTRTTLRHLAIFEKKFKQHGLAALHCLPIELLHKALHQLDTLSDGVATPNVVRLRAHIETALMEREPLDEGEPTVPAVSNFNCPDKLQVVEVPVSDFLRASQEFADRGQVKAA